MAVLVCRYTILHRVEIPQFPIVIAIITGKDLCTQATLISLLGYEVYTKTLYFNILFSKYKRSRGKFKVISCTCS